MIIKKLKSHIDTEMEIIRLCVSTGFYENIEDEKFVAAGEYRALKEIKKIISDYERLERAKKKIDQIRGGSTKNV